MLIVIEGLDGAGKSTQVALLQQYFEAQQQECRFIHFPRYQSPVYGELISAFLRGEFGDAQSVDPRLVALLYAGDRQNAAADMQQWLDQKKVLILDRYVYSNIAFQCAKQMDTTQRETLRRWIFDLEYNYFKIPQPDLSIFLDVPFSFTSKQLARGRTGNDRDYLQGKDDIHETDIDLQKEVRKVYLEQAQHDPRFKIIECAKPDSVMQSPEVIHQIILELITEVYSEASC